MTTITVQPNQSMLDVILQGCGSLEAGWQFCVDNGVSISDVPIVGVMYVVSDAALGLGDAGVLQYLVQNGVTVGTLAPPAPLVGQVWASDDGTVWGTEGGAPILFE